MISESYKRGDNSSMAVAINLHRPISRVEMKAALDRFFEGIYKEEESLSEVFFFKDHLVFEIGDDSDGVERG